MGMMMDKHVAMTMEKKGSDGESKIASYTCHRVDVFNASG